MLTKREIEILKLLSQGKTNREIAMILCISVFTVQNHVCNLLQKLNVKNRTEAAIVFYNNSSEVS